MKVLLVNRKAYRDYEITDKYEAGIQLLGYEVKSLREGKGSLKGTYVKKGTKSLDLIGMDIPKYSKAGEIFEFDSSRTRKLLLHKNEIRSIGQQIETKGYTAVPLKIHLENNKLKLLIGIGKGRKKEGLKRALIEKQQKLEMDRLYKNQSR